MTRCNICGLDLPKSTRIGFLCRRCEQAMPSRFLHTYRRAALAALRYRRGTVPLALRERLATAWIAASAHARSRL